MEVSGRKEFETKDNLLCMPCEDRNLCTRADGFCTECNEYICKACFDTHKQFKVSRGHTLVNLQEGVVQTDLKEELEKCDQHFSELIKFYCPQHEQVGCGDCMILEHKTCKVEYIRDKAMSFKGSPEFKSLIQGAKKYLRKAKELSTFIKKNKKKAEEINEKLIQDVNMFKEEIFAHVHKLTNAILKQGETIRAKDMKTMDALEEENKDSMIELSRMSEVIESQIDQPQKLFMSSILHKPKLNQLREQIDIMQGRNKIEVYEFQRNNNLERSVKDCKQLGTIQNIKPRNESDVQEVVKPKVVAPMPQVTVAKNLEVTQVSVPKKPQPLLDRQLICRNLEVDGEYLSYVDNGRGDVGLYVDKIWRVDRYFEVEILSMGHRGTIAIGAVPEDYPENQQPGLGNYSVGYHADKGMLYYGSRSGTKFGPKCNVGDRIGCKLYWYGYKGGWPNYEVVFTRNGNKIGEQEVYAPRDLHPAIGMYSVGEKVKVKLDAKMPE